MTGYERGTVQAGDLVTWHTSRGITTGRVAAVLDAEWRDRLARWDRDDPAQAWFGEADFGPLVEIECVDPECTSCKGGWAAHPEWKHYANECQLERATEDVEVALW